MTPLEAFYVQLHDHAWYARNCVWIKTKDGRLVNLNYNPAQAKLFEVWDRLNAEGKPVRIIVLKARREGISTGVAGRFTHDVGTTKNLNGQVIAHDTESTDFIFAIYKLMYDELTPGTVLEDGTKVQIKPKAKYSSRRELVFEALRSQLQVQTAGADKGKGTAKKASGRGRGKTLHRLHISELSQWPSAKETLVSLLQTVADVPGTVVVIESTANGVGDEFHKRWLDAKAGKSDYVPVFLSWLDFPEYRAPVPPEGLGALDAEEIRLKDEFNATDEQLQWRRRILRNECGGDPEQFKQEYPADDQEAFLVSGHPFFNRKALAKARKDQKSPQWVGRLDVKDGKVEFIQDSTGYLRVWAKPKPTGCYTVGADTAEGLATGDYSAGEVYDRDTGEQAAEWYGHIDPDLFGVELARLARWYNNAWLGPEVNKDGLTTCLAVVRERYARLFERERLDEREPEPTEKIGWLTNGQTRPVMLNDMEELVREGQLVMHSETLQSECWSFVRDEKGRPGAQEGCHDDTVMAMAIAIQLHKLCPMSRPVTPEEQARRRREAERARRPQVSKITRY
jgi:hypothetical protein